MDITKVELLTSNRIGYLPYSNDDLNIIFDIIKFLYKQNGRAGTQTDFLIGMRDDLIEQLSEYEKEDLNELVNDLNKKYEVIPQ